jgi:hypothetical protein
MALNAVLKQSIDRSDPLEASAQPEGKCFRTAVTEQQGLITTYFQNSGLLGGATKKQNII